jgi:hypothetical protein
MNTLRALLGWATDPSTYTSYAIGGHDNNGTPLATVEAYNLSANTWSFNASLPQTLYSELAVGDGAGANGAISNAVYCYTIATNTWAQVASMPIAVRDSAAVLGPNERQKLSNRLSHLRAHPPPARRCQAPTEFVSHRRRCHYSARTGRRRW